jgi:hypothetical protein
MRIIHAENYGLTNWKTCITGFRTYEQARQFRIEYFDRVKAEEKWEAEHQPVPVEKLFKAVIRENKTCG